MGRENRWEREGGGKKKGKTDCWRRSFGQGFPARCGGGGERSAAEAEGAAEETAEFGEGHFVVSGGGGGWGEGCMCVVVMKGVRDVCL